MPTDPVNVRIGRRASQGSAVTVLSILKKVTVQKHLSFEVEAMLNIERGKDKIKQGYGILRDYIQVKLSMRTSTTEKNRKVWSLNR
jgi:transposase